MVGVPAVMAISKWLVPACHSCQDCCSPRPWLPTHTSARGSQILPGKSVSLLWGHCSLLLGPGEHKALFVPSKSLFPRSCGMSIIKSHWPSKSNSLGILSLFAGSPSWRICCGPWKFYNGWENFFGVIVLQFVGCLLNDSIVALMPTSSKKLCHIPCLPVCWSQSPCPRGRPLLTPASTGDAQRPVWLSLFWGSLFLSLGPDMHKLLFVPLSVSDASEVWF